MTIWLELLISFLFPVVTTLGSAAAGALLTTNLEKRDRQENTKLGEDGSGFESHAKELEFTQPYFYKLSENIAFGYLSFDIWFLSNYSGQVTMVKLAIMVLLAHLAYMFYRKNFKDRLDIKKLAWWNLLNVALILLMRILVFNT